MTLYEHRNWMFVKVDRDAFAPIGQQKNETSGGYARCSDQQALLGLSRHAGADLPMVETRETFLTIGDDDEGKSASVAMVTIAFDDVDVNNTVKWTLNRCLFAKLIKGFCSNNLE